MGKNPTQRTDAGHKPTSGVLVGKKAPNHRPKRRDRRAYYRDYNAIVRLCRTGRIGRPRLGHSIEFCKLCGKTLPGRSPSRIRLRPNGPLCAAHRNLWRLERLPQAGPVRLSPELRRVEARLRRLWGLTPGEKA